MTESITLPIRAGELATALSGELRGPSDLVIEAPGAIDSGGPGCVSFIRAEAFAKKWSDSGCSAVLVTRGIEIPDHDESSRAMIVVDDADAAFARVLDAADPGRERPDPGVHPSAVIDEGATIDPGASIGAHVSIGPGTTIGAGAVVMPNVVVGAGVRVGAGSVLEPGCVIEDRCAIGERSVIGSNSVIGADGFGYLPADEKRETIKVPQIGRVEIGDDVELGACVTIDRAKLGATLVGDKVKIDNQVHVGHNSVIGEGVIICGRSTLGGSVTIGARALIGGAVILNDHCRIGENAKVAGGAIVLEEVPPNEAYVGIPALPARQALANHSAMRDIGAFVRRTDKALKKIEKRLDES